MDNLIICIIRRLVIIYPELYVEIYKSKTFLDKAFSSVDCSITNNANELAKIINSIDITFFNIFGNLFSSNLIQKNYYINNIVKNKTFIQDLIDLNDIQKLEKYSKKIIEHDISESLKKCCNKDDSLPTKFNPNNIHKNPDSVSIVK